MSRMDVLFEELLAKGLDCAEQELGLGLPAVKRANEQMLVIAREIYGDPECPKHIKNLVERYFNTAAAAAAAQHSHMYRRGVADAIVILRKLGLVTTDLPDPETLEKEPE